MSDSWYSDAALAKQAQAAALPNGTRPRVDLLCGMLEPRVQPTDDERCSAHGLDARVEAGGDGRFCGLCIGRGYDRETAQ